MKNKIKNTNPDLLIVGAGPVGCVIAERAAKILPLRRRGNLLLCTILLGNVSVNSGLSILMGDLTNGLTGLLVSTAVITMFGEIIP